MSTCVETNSISAFEAKTHLSSLLKKVQQGESFVITKHNQPIAVLSTFIPEANKHSIENAIEKIELLRQSLNLTLSEIEAWRLEGRR